MLLHYNPNAKDSDVFWLGFTKDFIYEKACKKTFLIEKAGNIYSNIRELSSHEVKMIDEANKVLNDFLFLERKRYELQISYGECINKIEYYKRIIKPMKGFNVNVNTELDIYVEINSVLTNFLSSFKSYVDINQMRIKRRYGGYCHNKKDCQCPDCEAAKDENAFLEFKDFINTARYCYDNYFSYAFFTKLRNYATHFFFPIESVDISVAHLADEESFIDFYFDKRILMNPQYEAKEFHKIAKQHKKTWDSLSDKFNIIPILTQIPEPISILHAKIFEIEEKRFSDASKILMYYFNLGKMPNREVLMVTFPERPVVHIDKIRNDFVEAIKKEKERILHSRE